MFKTHKYPTEEISEETNKNIIMILKKLLLQPIQTRFVSFVWTTMNFGIKLQTNFYKVAYSVHLLYRHCRECKNLHFLQCLFYQKY